LLTYCSNMHTAESWGELQRELRAALPVVRSALRGAHPSEPAPLGLWLSERMLAEIDAEGDEAFVAWCSESHCRVAALNGFPFGRFHGARVKERVYRPDWRTPERVAHTLRLAERLARWLPEGGDGSVTTVPLGWRDDLRAGDRPAVVHNLLEVLDGLEKLRASTGRSVTLALEPEPGCWLETVEQAAAFVGGLELGGAHRELLGVCLDACHEAVMFQGPLQGLRALRRAGVPLLRVQASAGLRCRGDEANGLAAVAESPYLHQTQVRHAGSTTQYVDLPEALGGQGRQTGSEWRVHVHVPLAFGSLSQALGPGVDTTSEHLVALLAAVPAGTLVELETYGWELLPPDLRPSSLAAGVRAELDWLRKRGGPWLDSAAALGAARPSGGPGSREERA